MKSPSFIPPDLGRIDGAGINALTIFKFNEKKPFSGVGALVDWRLYGHLSKLVIEGFFTGAREESLLMPLGRHLGPDCLLVIGLGNPTDFNRRVYGESLNKLSSVLAALNHTKMAVSLPGRPDEMCSPPEAMEWFFDSMDRFDFSDDIRIVEPVAAQEDMIPVLERWRLRQLVP